MDGLGITITFSLVLINLVNYLVTKQPIMTDHMLFY